MRLSATVIALDEAARLGECLKSLAFCDEIVVVDSGSTDATAAIARAHGARVFGRPFDDFARQHAFADQQATGAWILSLDADERASPALQAAARAIADAPPGAIAAYALPFQNHLRGVWLRHGGLWPDRHVRLYQRARARHDLSRPVHERLIVDGPIARLDAPVIHLSWTSLEHCLEKSLRYGETAARALHAQGRRAGPLDVHLRPLWRFVRAYFLQLGFLDGAAGLGVARARAQETRVRYQRLRELGRGAGP